MKTTPADTMSSSPAASLSTSGKEVTTLDQHIVEIVSDSGEGTQTAGQLFGTISARMGNGVWIVEIIPAEIEPPQRSREGASGNRIRFGTDFMTNMGDVANVAVAFNEQVPYSRIDVGAFDEGTILFIENKWADDPEESVRKLYADAIADFNQRGYLVHEIPMEVECLKHVSDARRGKNIWVLGMLCSLYNRDLTIAREEIAKKFGRKGEAAIASNLTLFQGGYDWAQENLSLKFDIPVIHREDPMVVMNGNVAIALGAMAAGFELCSMYPITPATSASHFLATAFRNVGGFVHQAEDEIAAIGFALGASYAGKTSLTITSGPGMALKTEFIALAVMAEIPVVIVDVQRGGPSTGLPTRIEQSDLLASLFGSPGDVPKIIMAPSCIEECFHFMITARQLAETFRGPVVVLSDANLATGVQLFPRPKLSEEWLSPPVDQSDWDKEVLPYAWDPETGISQRAIPGQRGGEHILTGLAHDERSKIAYGASVNQRGCEARSRKLATLARTLKPPVVHGDPEGDLLVVGWGSTAGAIQEAVDMVRRKGGRVSCIHLRFLSPLEPGLKDIFSRFKQVITIELNYSDDPEVQAAVGSNIRNAQLAHLLRNETLHDVDCWSRVPGVPLSPGAIRNVILKRMNIA
jgi:2-oxoglutarate ferredoxin oxidoreductase subunit alpha